ncbi:hypothetical protein BRADI_4g13205v3 [Brachypodium distachyon]|uniref:Uncharacterized protein n=1 Tax=Brachypodium distachyon TaxID=15368 RepID=A0A0Q3EN64_BRADI|nr:hypothetical protein BRADI_4g13205v3 [Brachypodium distachyon]
MTCIYMQWNGWLLLVNLRSRFGDAYHVENKVLTSPNSISAVADPAIVDSIRGDYSWRRSTLKWLQ